MQTSPNELDRPDGALIEASNVIIKRDGIIEQRRGFSLYGTELPDSTASVKQLTTYRNRILRHFNDILQYDSDGAGNFQSFSGSFTEAQAGLRMKFIESNGNLFFTTDKGIKKISARNADDLTTDTGLVVSAGAIKAVDLSGKAVYEANSQGAWFPQDSAVAYRVVWAYNDLNANLIQGAPSQRLVVSNPMTGMLIRDYTRLLAALDNFNSDTSYGPAITSANINDRDYIKILGLTLNATASELYTKLLALTTKLDNDILYADQASSAPLQITSASIDSGTATVNLTGAASGYFIPGSKIYLDGFNLETRKEIQTVKFTPVAPTTGVFKLRYGSVESAAINWDDSLDSTNCRISFSQIPTSGTFTLKYNLIESSVFTVTTGPTATPKIAAIQSDLRTKFGLSGLIVTSGTRTATTNGGNDIIDYSSGLTISGNNFSSTVTIGATNTLSPATILTSSLSNSVYSKIKTIDGLQNATITGGLDTTGMTLQFPASDGDLTQIVEGSGNTTGQTIQTATVQSGIKSVVGKINEGQTIVSVNEIQKLTFSAVPSSGSFQVVFNGYSSSSIDATDTLSIIKSKLNLVKGLETVTVSSGSQTPSQPIDYTKGLSIDFGTIGSKSQLITISSNSLSPATTISVSATSSLTFNTDAAGAVTLSTATIHSNEYRSLSQPAVPDIPATNNELVDLQVYLEDIITRLSSEPEKVISSKQKITFSAVPTVGSFTFTYGSIETDNISVSASVSAIQTELRKWTGLENVVVDATSSFSNGFKLSSPDGLPYPLIMNTGSLSTPATTASTSTSDLLSLDSISLTTTSTAELTITIPQGIDSNYFFQVYRTSVAQATGVVTFNDLVPNEEYQQVYEAYPTEKELNIDHSITIQDVTPDAFRGANLYTNASTGDGILQSNEIPPVAKDINRYRGSIFYANTRTRQQLLLNLLGVTNMINSFDINNPPKLTISNGTQTNTYKFVTGQKEVVEITVNSYTGLNNKYFLISSTETNYYVWFSVDGAGVDPLISEKTGIKVNISSVTDTSTVLVAQKIKDILSTYLSDFIPTISGSVVTVQNYSFGVAADAQAGTSGFVIKIQDGRSEDESTLSVLLSVAVSPSQAVDETAKSLVRIINKNPNESVYAYYISSAYDVPGKIYLEARQLEQTSAFYVLGNNDTIGASFNPDISPNNSIITMTTANPTVITSSSTHGLLTGDQVMITDSNSAPSVDGLYSVTVIDSTRFSINKAVTVSGTGKFIKASAGVYSENEQKVNRVYYSKYQQPEAVPAVNYFDVGSQDKAILRILPLRTSLFVFKEDGLYRISGDSAPFQLELFDISFNVLAPDSVVVCNNVIYAWTTQGIQSLTEGGASIISRSIDNIVLKTQSSNFPYFKTATWGVGYESDNSYLVYTVKNQEDTYATIAYRFSTLTNSWTTYNLSHVSGVINPFNDKLYLSASDVAYIEQERKTFSRLDYADREIDSIISAGKLINNTITLANVSNLSVGDVVVQEQTITTTIFNILLEKLDNDNGVTGNDYLELWELIRGKSPRDQLVGLANKLDSDTGVSYSNFLSTINTKSAINSAASAANSTIITKVNHGLITGRVISITGSTTSPTINSIYPVTVIDADHFSIPAKVKIAGIIGNWQTVDTNFNDLQTCYNFIVNTLNVDPGISFNNYPLITNTTSMESIITSIDAKTKKITTNLTLDYLIGDITIYKAFESSFSYSPITFGDPLLLKHIREATMMFETRTLTGGTLGFRTDLLPELVEIDFKLSGNGIFGYVDGFGDGFFGGLSNAAPFRTYIPRQCQRCRYMIVRFSHSTAREDYRVNGCTLTGEVSQSSRAYR